MGKAAVERRENSVSLTVDGLRALFVRKNDLWFPDWFYQGERRMLRFKDHEWLSVGHVRGGMAGLETRDERLIFSGRVSYGTTAVEQRVVIEPARDGGPGFTIETTLRAEQNIELLEALASFETPYEYDGREDSLIVMGAQAVVHWKDGRLLTPPVYRNPAWIYNHPEQARTATQPWSPHVAHRLRRLDGSNARWIRFIGHKEECSFPEMFVTTTRAVGTDGTNITHSSGKGVRGWKYIPCALNWSSSLVKDPNILCRAGEELRQVVSVDFTGDPGAGCDEWVYGGWERLLAMGLPADGKVAAYAVARKQGASWRKASEWSIGVLRTDPIDILYNYLPGTRPKAARREGYVPAQWLAPAAFQAVVLQDDSLRERVAGLLDTAHAEYWRTRGEQVFGSGEIQCQLLPSLQALSLLGDECAALRRELERVLRVFRKSSSSIGRSNNGTKAVAASAALYAWRVYGEKAWRKLFLKWIDEVDANIEKEKWWWTSAQAERDAASQIRPLGMGYVVEANLRAYRETGDAAYLKAALFYGRMVLAVCAAPLDQGLSEDLDLRGWMNGTNTGRDQICQIPPWETFSAARAIGALAGCAEVPGSMYDTVWYLQRTGLAAFPAARTLKRIHGAEYLTDKRYVPIGDIASEADFYLKYPYMAYENPHDQTLLAAYQSEPIWNALVLGGILAEASDDRVLALVPGAAVFDFTRLEDMSIRLWNPTPSEIRTDVEIAGGRRSIKDVSVPPRSAVSLTLDRESG